MKPNEEYQFVEAQAPFKGLATALAPTRLNPAYSPALMNVVVRDGDALSRAGYAKIGQTLDSSIMAFASFGPLAAVPSLVVFTKTRQYYFDSTTQLFVDITAVKGVSATGTLTSTTTFTLAEDWEEHLKSGDEIRLHASTNINNNKLITVSMDSVHTSSTLVTTTSALVDSGSTTVEFAPHAWNIQNIDNTGTDHFEVLGNHTAYFAAGTVFIVSGATDSSNDGEYTVVSVADNSNNTDITVAALGGDNQPGAAGTIVAISPLTTTGEKFIDRVEYTDINRRRLLMTNGSNRPIEWSGTLSERFDQFRPNYEGFTTCRTVSLLNDHLFLGAITLAASGEADQEVAWSDTGRFNEFTLGNSGVQILAQFESAIKAMQVLGDRLVIYSDDQIVNAAFIGAPLIFAFETIIPEGTRLISPKSVISINLGHVYAAQENIYIFDGSRGLRVLGNLIRNDYKSVKNNDHLFKACSLNDFAKRTIYLALPDITDALPDGTGVGSIIYTLEYDVFNLSEMVWGKEKYDDDVRAMGFYYNTVVVKWPDTASEANAYPSGVTWEDDTATWANEGEQLDFPIRCFGNEAGEVFIITEGIGNDNGADFTSTYETVDFTIPNSFQSTLGRWAEIEYEARGSTVDVSVSTGLGQGFTMVTEGQTLTGDYAYYSSKMDVSGRTLRVRFQTRGHFGLRWVRLWVREGGPR